MDMTILQRFKQAHTQQLTAEIAHKVLQPLTATTNYINGSLHYLKEANVSKDVIQALEQAVHQIKRSGDTMNTFRQHLNTDELLAIDANQLVSQVLFTLHKDTKQLGIEVNFDPIKNLPKVRADQAQMEYVLLLLIMNIITLIRANNISGQNLGIVIEDRSNQVFIEIHTPQLVLNDGMLNELEFKLIQNIMTLHKGSLTITTDKLIIVLPIVTE